jgi:hypothetical protein
MKGMLLLLIALALSAQTLDRYPSPEVPSEYFTDGRLNGRWWKDATAMERWIYLAAASDARARKVWVPDDAYKTRKLITPLVDVVAITNTANENIQLQRALDCLVAELRGSHR